MISDIAAAEAGMRARGGLLLYSLLGAAAAVTVNCLAAGGRLLHGLAASLTAVWGLAAPAATITAGVGLVLIGVGAFAYFRPLSAKGAFGGGFAMVAVLAIFIA